ncbi:tetratricopeptide repeat protein [Microbispora sp. RL4-1S]|uniref:Tetratricopeptide repeat protein n=1 Tax=Microbispora oryzae TaxID=2806554 RepID=A0A940WKT7_9ACTN|nr:tetratricopeptide repeat protein [Microbispora oryzae]MBP2706808.1 tetratricopeptide repeat protein [Microbispora oryzae]
MDNASFGSALRDLRRKRGLSLASLSALTHYSKGYLSRIETGERPPTPLVARRCDEVLRADGALTQLVPAGPRHQDGFRRPAQLPAAPRAFAGRAAALAELDGAQRTHQMLIISGPAGVGKTATALHWSHRAAHRFPDGCLFADLRGFDPTGTPAEPADVLARFLRDLGCSPTAIPAGVEPRSVRLRTLLHGRRTLIVVDNAATSDQVRPLIPGSAGCRLVVTSRSRLSGLVARDGAARVVLAPLPEFEALTQLGHAIGSRRVAEEPEAAAEIARRCGYLPLALRIAAERAQARPSLRLAALATELAVTRDRLNLLATTEDEATAVRSVFSWSYRALPADTARMFRLLGLHRGDDIGVAAAAALAGLSRSQARRLLEALAAVHLLEEAAAGRYRFSDLIRLYAAECAEADESPEDRSAAVRRLFTWYLHAADAADRRLDPLRHRAGIDAPDDGRRPITFTGYGEALGWFDAEHANLAVAVRHAAETEHGAVAWRLANAGRSYFDLRRPWAEWVSAYQAGLSAAQDSGDEDGEAWMSGGLAAIHRDLGSLEEALEYGERALAIRRRAGDRAAECACLNDLGDVLRRLGRATAALERLREALALSREIGRVRDAATALTHIGETYLQTGRIDEALRFLSGALAPLIELRERNGEARVLDDMGVAYHTSGRADRAVHFLRAALRVRRELGDRYGTATTLRHLGEVCRDLGEEPAATSALREALRICEELDDPRAGRLRELLGEPPRRTLP